MSASQLAPWTDDDLIEFLLATHRACCSSVMARVKEAPDRDVLGGRAELCRIVLEQMIADESVTDARTTLARYLDSQLGDRQTRTLARWRCLAALLPSARTAAPTIAGPWGSGCDVGALRAMRHEAVQVILSAAQVREDLKAGAGCDYLADQMPRALVLRTARAVADDARARERLRGLMRRRSRVFPIGASILHATGTGWVPSAGGSLAGVSALTAAGGRGPGRVAARVSRTSGTRTLRGVGDAGRVGGAARPPARPGSTARRSASAGAEARYPPSFFLPPSRSPKPFLT